MHTTLHNFSIVFFRTNFSKLYYTSQQYTQLSQIYTTLRKILHNSTTLLQNSTKLYKSLEDSTQVYTIVQFLSNFYIFTEPTKYKALHNYAQLYNDYIQLLPNNTKLDNTSQHSTQFEIVFHSYT